MDYSQQTESYNEAINRFYMKKALGSWMHAAKAIEDAIIACPIREALPQLEAFRLECDAHTARRTWWQRLLEGARA